MVILIAGSTHTGKTALAQKMLEAYHYPYISIDHLKMGLIRSGNTDLTPMDDQALTEYLWPIVREMIKTAIENQQNLIVEGCYIPFEWAKDFSKSYLSQIRYLCLVFSRSYIEDHFAEIAGFANVIETRLDDSGLSKEELIRENEENLEKCQKFGCPYYLIDEQYPVELSQIMKRETV